MNIRDLKCLLALNRTVLHLSWLRQCRRRTVRLLAWLSPTVSDFVRSLGKYENILTTIISKQSSIKGRGCLNREIPFKTTSKVQNFVAYVILKKKGLLTIATNNLFYNTQCVLKRKGATEFHNIILYTSGETYVYKWLRLRNMHANFDSCPKLWYTFIQCFTGRGGTFPFQNNQ